jgi:hypothetical protein
MVPLDTFFPCPQGESRHLGLVHCGAHIVLALTPHREKVCRSSLERNTTCSPIPTSLTDRPWKTISRFLYQFVNWVELKCTSLPLLSWMCPCYFKAMLRYSFQTSQVLAQLYLAMDSLLVWTQTKLIPDELEIFHTDQWYRNGLDSIDLQLKQTYSMK